LKKFNLIDIIVILVILAVTASALLILSKKPVATQNTRTVVLEVKEKSESFCKIPQKDDVLIDAITKIEMGKLVSKDMKKSTSDLTSLTDSKIVKSEMIDKYDLYLTIEMNNFEKEPRVGTALSIQGRTYTCSGFVVEVVDTAEVTK